MKAGTGFPSVKYAASANIGSRSLVIEERRCIFFYRFFPLEKPFFLIRASRSSFFSFGVGQPTRGTPPLYSPHSSHTIAVAATSSRLTMTTASATATATATAAATPQPPVTSTAPAGSGTSQERSLYITFFCLTSTFFICHLPRIALNVSEIHLNNMQRRCREELNSDFTLILGTVNYVEPAWVLIASSIEKILLIFNSSINFVYYCLVGKTFR